MHPPLYDAHCHLADSRLEPEQQEIIAQLKRIHCACSVVNGTSPADWDAVLAYAQKHSFVRPAIGLHPWKVNNAPANWQTCFLQAIERGAKVVGEIGLDQWIEGHDIARQQDAFHWQLAQATKHNLPTSIHCLRAMGPLMQLLRSVDLPPRGIHLHAYSGSAENVAELSHLGAYFSFNSGQLKPNAKAVIAAIQAVPEERLLIETDAPNRLPPERWRTHHLSDSTLNHPANLQAGYMAIAKVKNIPIEQLVTQVESNFLHYFGDD